MPSIGSRKEKNTGSRIGISSGIVLARPEDQNEPDEIMVEENLLSGVAFFLQDLFADVPLYIIPDSQSLAVLLDLSKDEPEEITIPILLRDKLKLSVLKNTPENILHQRST